MRAKYHSKRARKSWNFSFRGRKVSFGFWMNSVVDEVSSKASGSEKRHMNGLDPYRYCPLKDPLDIRLLILKPGGYSDPLRGSVIDNPAISPGNEAFGHGLKYEALSYVWGRPPSRQEHYMIIDEHYHLPLQPNLDIALRHLRSTTTPRTLWIDAICVNQLDDQEKNTQVGIMLEIYAKAEQVNIWLGPSRQDSDSGMAAFRYLAESSSSQEAPWIRTPEIDLLSGLRDLLQRDWFSRLWVVQEAVVSQKAVMMCGEESFQWTNDPNQVWKFIRRLKYAAISPQWEQAGLSDVNVGKFLQVLNLQMQYITRQVGQTFVFPPPDNLDVTFELRHRKATDPRDKLFAILGLVEQTDGSENSLFRPDYSVDVETTYKRFFDSTEM